MVQIPQLGALLYLEEGKWEMTGETHRAVSLSVMLQTSRGASERSTTVVCTLKHTCQCGVMSEYNWTSELASDGRLDDLVVGLIAEVEAVAGPAALRLHSQVYSSGWPTS